MARKPALTEDSFLNAIFHPKKNPLPAGLRKRPVVGLKGRKAARVRAYNNMPAANQEVLRRTGQRDAYLRGETTLAKAKGVLREKAVSLGIAKPVKRRKPKEILDTSDSSLAVFRWAMANLDTGYRTVNPETLRRMIPYLTEVEKDEIINGKKDRWGRVKRFTVADWKHRAGKAQLRMAQIHLNMEDDDVPRADEYVTVDLGGNAISPYFYH